MWTLAVLGGAATIGSCIVTLTGFGFLLTFLMLVALIDGAAPMPDFAGTDKQWLVYILGLVSAGLLALLDKRLVNWRWVALVALPSALTAPAGVYASLVLDGALLMRVMATLFIVAASRALYEPASGHP